MSRIIGFCAHFYFQAKAVPWLPNVVFGIMALLAGALTLYLPETLNRALPQTIEEVENWSRTLTSEEKERAKELRDNKKRNKRDIEMDDKSFNPETKPLKSEDETA